MGGMKVLDKDLSFLTQAATKEWYLIIQTKINSVQHIAKGNRKHPKDIVRLAETKQLKHHLGRF